MVAHFNAARKRIAREHNSRVTAAYYGGLVPHMSPTPKLDRFLIPDDAPRARGWQEIKAAMMVALPPEPKVK
jgi:hypothetical protein